MKGLRNRLGWKMGLPLSLALLGVMALLSIGDYFWQRSAFLDHLNRHIAEEAWTVAILLRQDRDLAEQQRLLKELAQALDQSEQHEQRHHELFILDRQAVVRASNMESLLGQRMNSAAVLRVLHGDAPFASGIMWHGDHLSFYGVAPMYDDRKPSGFPIGAIHVAEPLHPIQAYLNEFLIQRLLFMTLVTAALILLVNLLVRQMVVAPLRTLIRSMERVHLGDLDAQVPVESTDELAQIDRAFNVMIQAIQKSQRTAEQERNRLSLLCDINRRLASTMDWEEVVNLIVRVPGEIVDAVGCAFTSFDERSGRLVLEGAWGLEDEELLNLEFQLQQLGNRCLTCHPRMARVGKDCPLLLPQIAQTCGAQSILCLHLAQGERTVGFLHVYLPEARPLGPEKVQLLNAVAGEMAVVIAAAQLRARELAMLSGLDHSIHTSLNLQETLEQLLAQIREASRAAQGAIFLLDEETGALSPIAFQGLDVRELDRLRPLALDTVHRREPLLILEASQVAEFPWHQGGPASILSAPLMLDNRVLGVFLLADSRPRAFTHRQITLLSTIAGQIALIVRNSQLYARLESQAILEERTRLAREIHDGIVQTLGYLKLQVARMQKWARGGELERLQVELDRLREVLEDSYAEARDAIVGLRVGLNKGDTLENVLGEYVQSFSARYHLPVELNVVGDSISLQPTVILHLLRIVQEGLTNVRKHAHASHVWITLEYTPEWLTLTLSDDGQGFELQDAHLMQFRGIQFMRERAERVGGQLVIAPHHPQGTTVQVKLPLTTNWEQITHLGVQLPV